LSNQLAACQRVGEFRGEIRHVIVTDLFLPDLDGVRVTQRSRAELPETQVVILTGAALTERERQVQRRK
jgi:CheY-like chemotaxis protein